MKVYRIVLSVIDFEGHGQDDMVDSLLNNRHYSPSLVEIDSKDIGEWNDNHPLNQKSEHKEYFKSLFKDKS